MTAQRSEVWALCAAGFVLGVLWARAGPPRAATSKDESYPPPEWSPLSGNMPRSDYVGPQVCAACHVAEAANELKTPMGQAAYAPANAVPLLRHSKMEFRLGPYLYRITRKGEASLFSVTDGEQAITEPILYAFGSGAAGQTYIFKHRGDFYESRVSYFQDTDGLDVTFGYPRVPPNSLEEALGNRQSQSNAELCFNCHATAAVTSLQLDTAHLIPGVTCEACHGPGARHVAAMQAGPGKQPFIFNPGHLPPDELVDFCGNCHRAVLQVVSMHVQGTRRVRFQPYRLANSRCWNPDDARIQCLSCHDPHYPLVKEDSAYDSKCLACHVTGRGVRPTRTHPGAACRVANRECVTCHMPKVDLPDAHFRFTDHMIRIARKGGVFPE